jgi:hypothetical protein
MGSRWNAARRAVAPKSRQKTPRRWSRFSCPNYRKRKFKIPVTTGGGKMNSVILVDLSADEMRQFSGGASAFNCWGGGVMTVFGFASMNAIAATAGLWFIYNYC